MSFCCPTHGYYVPTPGVTTAMCPTCLTGTVISTGVPVDAMLHDDVAVKRGADVVQEVFGCDAATAWNVYRAGLMAQLCVDPAGSEAP